MFLVGMMALNTGIRIRPSRSVSMRAELGEKGLKGRPLKRGRPFVCHPSAKF